MTLPTNPNITYRSDTGREFRVSSISKVPDSGKWIDKVERFRWIALVEMLDNGEMWELESDYNDMIIKKSKV